MKITNGFGKNKVTTYIEMRIYYVISILRVISFFGFSRKLYVLG